jgi:hypothetical protein
VRGRYRKSTVVATGRPLITVCACNVGSTSVHALRLVRAPREEEREDELLRRGEGGVALGFCFTAAAAHGSHPLALAPGGAERPSTGTRTRGATILPIMRLLGVAVILMSCASRSSSAPSVTAHDAGPQDAGAPDTDEQDASVYIDPSCPVSFSSGCPGSVSDIEGGGGCAPFSCQGLPSTCAQDVTCSCLQSEFCVGSDQPPSCKYTRGTFVVMCIND